MSLKSVVDTMAGAATIDPGPARSAMLDKLRQARTAFNMNQSAQAGGHWLAADDSGRVAFSPTRPDGQQLVINGQSVTFWEADQVPALLQAFEAAITLGDLDSQLTGTTPAGHSLPLDQLTSDEVACRPSILERMVDNP
ncbi:hypothetical protein ACMGDM_18925 [Sphingomonas sp. DT-51]|uniref:hypothetical protein n=1 Tax=Sphingomonas sp. DT-51 TaxID=3396165 RepID=UPI003F1E1A71